MPKGKKKVKRRAAQKQDPREMIRALQKILISGTRRGGETGAYQRMFLLSSEDEMRSIESRLSSTERRALRTWLLCNIPIATRSGKTETNIIDFLMRGNGDTWRVVFTTSIMGAIHELWSADGHSDLPAYEGSEKVGKRFSESLRKHFRNLNTETYREQMMNLIYADHITARMGCMADWDTILPGDNLLLWSRNGLEILERFAGQNQLTYLRERREALILSLTGFVAELIPQHMTVIADTLRDEGISCSYGMKSASLLPSGRDMDVAFTPFSPLSGSQDLRASLPHLQQISEDYEDNEYANEALCHTTLLRLASGETYEAISRHLTITFSEIEILYAALSLMAEHQTVTGSSAAIQSLLAAVTFSGFPCNVFDYGYTMRDHRKKVTLNTTKLVALDEEQRRKLRQIAPDETGEMAEQGAHQVQNINLLQFIYSTTGAIVPPTLRISLREARVLESYGLSRTEAIALCGYMDGLRSMTRAIDNISDSWEPVAWEDEEDDGPTDEERREEIRQEVEAELESEMAAVRELRESTETARRKLMREHRTATYRAEKAETQLDDLKTENAQLRERIAALSAERDTLQETLLSVTAQEEEQSEPEAPLKTRFPSDIGKDIRFVIFGGSQNWIAEQHRRFPYIDFYDYNTQPNETIVANADILMLNTFVMHHKFFDMIQDAARRGGVPMRYFTSKGINRGSEEIIANYERFATDSGGEE